MEFDYDIRKTFNDILGQDKLFDLDNIISDYDITRLGVEFLRIATNRLQYDTKDERINEEYIKLKFIISQLEEIIKHYV